MNYPKDFGTDHWGGCPYNQMTRKKDIPVLTDMFRVMHRHLLHPQFDRTYVETHLNAINDQILLLINMYEGNN